ncbi:MAG: SDR family oxidoreductase [Elusimicrobia bacterium]|nr:SDR family oxidoreductase [Elusimicrobiota bacterium]
MTLKGRVALITGAARRVGRAIAMALAEKGARIAVHYNRSRAEGQTLARELKDSFGVDCLAFGAELGKTAQVRALAAAVARRFGNIDILINNASIYERTPLATATEKEWDRHLDVNLKAPFFLSQAVAPIMKKSGGGKIINIADWAGLRPYSDYTPYCISKAGLLCLNTALAKGLAPSIQVNAVMPGPVLLPEGTPAKTRKAIEKATLVKRLGSPQDVAQAVLFLLERGDFMTGAAIPVDGGRLIA